MTFIDPKGLRNLLGPEDPKISFYRVIKDLERRLADPDMILNSFIVAATKHSEVAHWDDGTGPMSLSTFKQRNIYFQLDETATYIGEIMDKIIAP
ncbi:MAG: hypothetical protein AB4911_15735 [Oscillochloridaceae bacterium umkhey_bin13]